ncbi:DNA ligase D [Salibacterium sp. K-3]
MRPARTQAIPEGTEWKYECKYDGYRAFLTWKNGSADLTSRNGHSLAFAFPEIITAAVSFFAGAPPFVLDGELVVLENEGKADFYHLQSRNRRRSVSKIQQDSERRPAAFLAFDCLHVSERDITSLSLQERKGRLRQLLDEAHLPLAPDPHAAGRIQGIPVWDSQNKLKDWCRLYRSEGIVAKRADAPWRRGRATDWLKYKTPYRGTCFITAWDPANDYFHLGIFQNGSVRPVGKCSHGLSGTEKEALMEIIRKNGIWDPSRSVYSMDPSIVLEVTYTSAKHEELREPRVSRLLLQTPAQACTCESWKVEALRFPQEAAVTHPSKPLWPDGKVQKLDFLDYVRKAAPFVLPFLQDRTLTVVRFPHGVMEDGFFQKDCPAYAPEFVETLKLDENRFIICNTLETLLWLANQLALEWHIPFQRTSTRFVDEIVFDLDPPDSSYFSLAVEGALLIKEVLDAFNLESFVKFSGHKGLQIYIPLPADTFTWEDTGFFNRSIGELLTKKHDGLFTTERRKKRRGGRVYLDIPQHARGKTIIAPYSLRGKEEPLTACPLFWDDLTSDMDRTAFTMQHTLYRTIHQGCPFQHWNGERNRKPLQHLLHTMDHVST